MISKLIQSVCDLVISYYEISIIIVIGGYFQVWNYINKKLIKNFCYRLIFWNHFFRNYLLLPFSGSNLFSISVILDFVCTLSVNKGFTVFQNVLLSVMARVVILIRKFLFSRLIKLTQRLCCLSYAFLLMSLFVFKYLFLSSDLSWFLYLSFYLWRNLVCTNISLFRWSVSFNNFIKCCFENIKLKLIVFKGHLRYPTLNTSHKYVIRKMFIVAICDNGWLLFFVENFHYC